MPHRERYLFVCTNRREEGNPKGSCAQKGGEELVKRMKAALLARGLHKTARACSASCLDLCEEGAAIVLEPDHVVYGNVTLDDVDAIADALAKGEVVERLVVHRGASGASGAHGAPASEGASPPSPGGAEGGA